MRGVRQRRADRERVPARPDALGRLQVLDQLGAPERLELEITESVMMQDSETTLQQLAELHRIPVTVSAQVTPLSRASRFPRAGSGAAWAVLWGPLPIDADLITDEEAFFRSLADQLAMEFAATPESDPDTPAYARLPARLALRAQQAEFQAHKIEMDLHRVHLNLERLDLEKRRLALKKRRKARINAAKKKK